MAQKKIYKSTVILTVLSEEPIIIFNSMDFLGNLMYEVEEGDWLLGKTNITDVKLIGKKAVEAIYMVGSDPEFFMMDDNGDELESFLEDIAWIDAIFVSEWDDGITVNSKCRYNTISKKVKNIEQVDINGVDLVTDEYVLLADDTEIRDFKNID